MNTTMRREEVRYERFAQLRAANPDLDFREIMDHIHGEEISYNEAGRDYAEILEVAA